MSDVYCSECDSECEEVEFVIGDKVTGTGYECPNCGWECDGDLE